MPQGRRLILTTVVVATALAVVLATSLQPRPRERVVLYGSGSTFAHPQVAFWSMEFSRENPAYVINYNPVGSGAGQKQFLEGTVDFAITDPPLSRSQWVNVRGRVLQIPVILGAVVIVYNIPGLEGQLRLDARVLAGIYNGEVGRWDHEEIRRLNPGLDLPGRELIAVHRSDSSGTTQVFTLFLNKGAPDRWPGDRVGKSVEWPVDATGRGVGGKGNQGVVEIVKRTPYSLGYVELSYALQTGLPYALVKNREGVFVGPGGSNIAEAAVNALEGAPDSPLEDWSQSLYSIVYAPGRGSYPISSFSYLLVWRSYEDESKEDGVRLFLDWLLRKGYDLVVEGYTPIPDEVRSVTRRALEALGGGASG